MTIETMKQALEALTHKKWFRIGLGEPNEPKVEAAIAALRTAIAEAEKQEPVAWMDEFGNVFPLGAQRGPKYLNEPMKPLYTTPPAAPVQEPRCAVIVEVFGKDWRLDYMSLPVEKHRLYTQQYVYTTPPAAQRQWVELTFAEICECENDYLHLFARAIEAKLKEKNT